MGKPLIQQKRGKGSPTYRRHSFRSPGTAKVQDRGSAKIIALIKSRFHTAPLAKVKYQDGAEGLLIAPEGMKVGQEVKIGADAPLELGNTLPLKDLPEGSFIYNIEKQPGDGGKFVRASGGVARVIGKTSQGVIIQLPSKKRTTFNPNCKATLGVVAGGGRRDKPIVKAGTKFHLMKAKNKYWPKVSGTAMNAVDHPLGGKRTGRKGRPTIAPKNAPPGRKVGMIRPRHTGRNK
ncbi:50S ribosomal protein L2 [Candidatus Woesearchaeota archaeon]|nr:50S ribosomal protein L2 [Candidatus Woesearchaeota archaeon]